jgi:hypothetical protein
MHSTQNKDDDAELLAGFPASSLVRRSGQPVVLVFSQRPAAQRALADESDLDEGVSSLGSLSVRLLAEWSKPRMMLGPPGGDGDPSAR